MMAGKRVGRFTGSLGQFSGLFVTSKNNPKEGCMFVLPDLQSVYSAVAVAVVYVKSITLEIPPPKRTG